MRARLDVMRIVGIVVGIVIACFGAIWTLQGFGLLPGTFMYENPTWIAIGLVVAVIGAGIGYLSWRGRKTP
jgi:hypothetical protein